MLPTAGCVLHGFSLHDAWLCRDVFQISMNRLGDLTRLSIALEGDAALHDGWCSMQLAACMCTAEPACMAPE
jgi:hypothetical protein